MTLEQQLVTYARGRPEGFTAKEGAAALGGKRVRHVGALMNNVRKDSAYRVEFVTMRTLTTSEKVYGLAHKHVAGSPEAWQQAGRKAREATEAMRSR